MTLGLIDLYYYLSKWLKTQKFRCSQAWKHQSRKYKKKTTRLSNFHIRDSRDESPNYDTITKFHCFSGIGYWTNITKWKCKRRHSCRERRLQQHSMETGDLAKPKHGHSSSAGGRPHALWGAETRAGWRGIQEIEAIARGKPRPVIDWTDQGTSR